MADGEKEPKISTYDRLRELEIKAARLEAELANHLQTHAEGKTDLKWKVGFALTVTTALISLLLQVLG